MCYARLFAKYHMRSPAEMGEDQIRQYLLHMVEEKKISRETYRQIRAALIFLYTITLKRETEVDHLPVRRKKVKLPVPLSGTEVQALLNAVRVAKYRAIVMAQYAGGLRISEACRLRPEDIDSRRMVIHVRAGKGGRDRYTVLSARFLAFLRDYFRKHRPDPVRASDGAGDRPAAPGPGVHASGAPASRRDARAAPSRVPGGSTRTGCGTPRSATSTGAGSRPRAS